MGCRSTLAERKWQLECGCASRPCRLRPSVRACQTVDVPCHRVVAAGGQLGGFASDLGLKRLFLRAEGVSMTTSGVRNFAKVRWQGR